MVSGMDLRNCVLDGHAHWRHLANMVKQWCVAGASASATMGSDVASSQITLDSLVISLHLHWLDCVISFVYLCVC